MNAPDPERTVGLRVDLLTTEGRLWGRGLAVGHFDFPSYVVDLEDGRGRTGWAAHLTRLTADDAPPPVEGHHAGGVPPFLPSELSTVDDVGRVCAAAGLTYDDHDGEWKADGIRVSRSFGLGRTMTVYAHYPMQGRRPIVDLFYGAETTVLWSAIQAARGGERRG